MSNDYQIFLKDLHMNIRCRGNIYEIDDRKDGDVGVDNDGHEYIWWNGSWNPMSKIDTVDSLGYRNEAKHMYPKICTRCGAQMHSFVCEFCGTEYGEEEIK